MHQSTVEILGPAVTRGYQSAVSLHAHTWHSKETLGFLPGWMAAVPLLGTLFQRELRQYRLEHGRDLDFERAFWRPPLMPAAVCESEIAQIAGRLDLDPLVSLTDHDSIEAPLSLRAAATSFEVPVSVEWTVPFDGAVFHIGVHNLPAGEAPGLLQGFADYTSRPARGRLSELLSLLHAFPEVLTVLNHPLWNGDVNEDQDGAALEALLGANRGWFHALELNGYRRWSENDVVTRLARQWDLPVVAGGDRNGRAPNALLNLSHARTFAEFAEEIRVARRSHVVIMPEYLDQSVREVRAVSEILGSDPTLLPEYQHWSQRVFMSCEDGAVRRLVDAWNGSLPYWIRGLVGMLRLMGTAPARPVLWLAMAGGARWF